MTITVDLISDVICPWCLLGKRRLEKALAALGVLVKVRWLPFQLNPTMPEEGIDLAFDWIERTPNTLDAYQLIWLAEAQRARHSAGCGINSKSLRLASGLRF
jgi:predicted DsbA family dithiol-disulfide isomerase